MNEMNPMVKVRKLSTKMIIEAFSPVGAPRTPGRERHYVLMRGGLSLLSDRGGETDAR